MAVAVSVIVEVGARRAGDEGVGARRAGDEGVGACRAGDEGVGARRAGDEGVGRSCGRRGRRCWERPGWVADPLSHKLTLV